MTKSLYDRSDLARAALESVAPMIRETLYEESDFREKFGLKAETLLHFGESGFSVKRSDLFDAIRRMLSGAVVKEVTDTDGRKWKLEKIRGKGGMSRLEVSLGEQHVILPDFSALSADSDTRLRYLDIAVSDVNLPRRASVSWRNLLEERPLEDSEFDAFHADLLDTPVAKARIIRKEILGGQSNIASMVPHSREYFERLVGTYDGSASIQGYAAGRGREIFDRLCSWREYDGFLFSLFLSSHSSLTAEINVDRLDSDELVRAFDFLDKQGDRISQLGAIEVGLRVLPARPQLEPVLISLIEQIRDDDAKGKSSGFKLLSALFLLVDGALSRKRLLSKEPPFYRRLAALSQAALIHRQLVNTDVDIDQFSEWVFSNYGGQYYQQSLADMRMEPRWNPDLAEPSQVKADFFGRIMIVAKIYEQNIDNSKLSGLVLSTEPGSLHSLSDFFHPYLPGPLEGGEGTQNIPPAEVADTIAEQLGAGEVGPSSFIALVNSALIFQVGADQAELAAKALKVGSHRLANVEDRTQLLAILNGLAMVSAVTRSHLLADELRILVRRYRRDTEYALSIKEEMRICLVAAASRADSKDWREFAGDWLTELAFSDLKGDDGEVLYSHLQCLCHVVPELWVSCGRADAALMAYNGSRHPT